MGRKITKSIQRVEREDNKSTSPCVAKKRRKILSRNQCIRTYNRRGSITRIRQKMETHYILVKNNATRKIKLQNIQQRISGGYYKIEAIFVGCHREI